MYIYIYIYIYRHTYIHIHMGWECDFLKLLAWGREDWKFTFSSGEFNFKHTKMFILENSTFHLHFMFCLVITFDFSWHLPVNPSDPAMFVFEKISLDLSFKSIEIYECATHVQILFYMAQHLYCLVTKRRLRYMTSQGSLLWWNIFKDAFLVMCL